MKTENKLLIDRLVCGLAKMRKVDQALAIDFLLDEYNQNRIGMKSSFAKNKAIQAVLPFVEGNFDDGDLI